MKVFDAVRRLAVALALLAAWSAQAAEPPGYTLDSTGWQRNKTPNGEVFTCSICEAQIQIQIDIGPPLASNAKFKSNDEFLANLKSDEQQREFANGLLRSQVPAISGVEIEIGRTGITSIGGEKAFQFTALVKMKPMVTRDTTMLLIHKSHLVKISLNYYDGSFTEKSAMAVKKLFSSMKFE